VDNQPALKVIADEIDELKKQVENVRKKVKALTPSPSAADLLNRIVGNKALLVLRDGTRVTGTLAEHDRYNCWVETADGPMVLLKHAINSIQLLD
jgi:hypothetical protein